MKHFIGALLIGLYLPSLRGSADIKAQVNEFLKNGSMASILVSDDDDNDISEQVTKWAGAFPTLKEFGAYYNPDDADQITILGKCIKSGDQNADELIQYLVDACDAQLDVGPVGKTPRDFLESSPMKEEWAYLFDSEDRFVRVVEGWLRGEYTTTKVIEMAVSLNITIDEAKLSDSESVRNLLVAHADKKEVRKVLAHCAPRMNDKYAAFAYLMVGCCEFPEDEVQLKLLSMFMIANPDLETDRICDSFEEYSALGLPWEDYFTTDALEKPRGKKIHGKLKKYFVATEGSNSPHPEFLWITDGAEDRDVAKLVLDCARNGHRDQELSHYLNTQNEAFYLNDIDYTANGMMVFFDQYFESLDEEEYPHKGMVRNRVNEQLFEHLLSIDPSSKDFKRDLSNFVRYIKQQSNSDIDAMPFQDTTIGEYVDSNAHQKIACARIREKLESYRSNPADRIPFLEALNDALTQDASKVTALKTFLVGKKLNVDRIVAADGTQTVAQFLHAHAKGPGILDLPALQSYRDDALAYKELMQMALMDETQIDAFKNLCAKNKFDVDTLLFASGDTVGAFLAGQLETGNWKEALKIAQLVQDERSDKEKIVRVLFKSIEYGERADELKAWCTAFPSLNLNAMRYDPADPKNTETIGSIIDDRYPALAKDLGRTATPQVPTKGKANEWSTSKKLGCAALLACVGIGYYYYGYKDPKKKAQDQDAVAAVA